MDYSCHRLSLTLRGQRVLAFEFGRGLSLLRWYIHLTIILGKLDPKQDPVDVLEDLLLLSKTLDLAARGGYLRRQIEKTRDDWEGILNSEWLGDHWNAMYQGRDDDAIATAEEVQEGLLGPIPAEEDIWNRFFKVFSGNDELCMAMQLGRSVEEWRFPGGKLPLLIRRKRRLVKRRLVHKLPRRRISVPKHHAGYASWRLHLAPSRPPLSVPPAIDAWIKEILIFWEHNRLAAELPLPDDKQRNDPVAFCQYIENLIAVVHRELENWPPDDGWHVRGDTVAFQGKRESITGQQLTFLTLICSKAVTGRQITSAELIKALWKIPDSKEKDLKNLRRLKSETMTKLKKLFDLPPESKPITTRGEGLTATWHLS